VKSFVASPTLYAIWALLVVGALCGTYVGDPYQFGLTTFGLCGSTVALGILGLAICLFSERPRARDRAFILGSLAIAAAAIALALQALGTFHWA